MKHFYKALQTLKNKHFKKIMSARQNTGNLENFIKKNVIFKI